MVVIEVVSHLSTGSSCIALTTASGLARGSTFFDTGHSLRFQSANQLLGRMLICIREAYRSG